ncbi:lipopolysaccharide biosynthesis protein [Aliiruegeria lutimaris]|uniref:Membrane protein involved in the export of O-antigen and teichoic acid n=1 Tax=Aliiruegeria lutimaris TaxID=571298 RepID=A0A1G9QBH5_9RHOB|nr:lipopolysaccharide biosynthesis protein [Aliiruegeria lutimaris]SDM08293.1 Membrane protein involved in the export of O-antigen and teichoic acid [Aliiruegeria lutimaris]
MSATNFRSRFARLGDSFEGLLSHIGLLLSANVIIAGVGLGTLAIMTHALGAVGIGVLALIEAYPRTLDQVLRFEPSQAIIRYGNRAREAGNDEAFRRLIKFGTLMDFLGAALAATLALAALDLASRWFNFSEDERRMMALFVFAMFTFVSATPISVLRLTSRFDLYARILVAVALTRFLLSGVLWLAGAGLEAFFYLAMFTAIAEHVVLFCVAWWVLRRNVEGPILSLPLKEFLRENPRIVSFIFNSNMNVLARNSTRRFDVFILGGVVGYAEIGLYQIAKRVGLAATRLSRPMQFVVFPALSQFWERGEGARIVKLVLRFSTVFAIIAVILVPVFVIWGDQFISLAFGQEFIAAQPLVILQIVAASLFMTGSILNSALLSIGRDGALLSVTLSACLFFFVALVPAVNTYGIVAASCLHVLTNLIWCSGCVYFFAKSVRMQQNLSAGISE